MSPNRVRHIDAVTAAIAAIGRPATTLEIWEFLENASISQKAIANVLHLSDSYGKREGFWWEWWNDAKPAPMIPADAIARHRNGLSAGRIRGNTPQANLHRELLKVADDRGRVTVGDALRIYRRMQR